MPAAQCLPVGVSRHRQQLADGIAVRESAARSIGTAGSAVVFAGATVLIAPVWIVDRPNSVPDRHGPGSGGLRQRRGGAGDHPVAGAARIRR
ncbi:MMPL family transporter [Nocardia sp. bgisy118]|uniref:MMPL family transporter n=1 Tax=Nocardia sp. bgisy118 TaxID=3413786 RepID=UPI003F49FDA2